MLTTGHHQIKANGLELSVEIAGEGPPLLFLTPGFGPSIEAFKQLRPLEERFTVFWTETRGTGRSEAPPYGDYKLSSFTRDAEALREALGIDRWWIGGHAWSTVIAQDYAAHHPERCAGSVQVCPGIAGAEERHFQQQTMPRIRARADHPLVAAALEALPLEAATDAEALAKMSKVAPIYFHQPEQAKAFLDDIPGFSIRVGAMKAQLPPTSDRTVRDVLPTLDLPTVLLAGLSDPICSPAVAQEVHHLLPDSKVVMVEDAGHFPWFEARDQFWAGLDSALGALSRRQ